MSVRHREPSGLFIILVLLGLLAAAIIAAHAITSTIRLLSR
jgi:hypothetical protein